MVNVQGDFLLTEGEEEAYWHKNRGKIATSIITVAKEVK